jgi:N-acetylglucosamine malate deacetylase 1
MRSVCVISPHPDDELIGAGGSILRFVAHNIPVYWLVVTEMKEKNGYTTEKIAKRVEEIEYIKNNVPFTNTSEMGLPAGELDESKRGKMISCIKENIAEWKPDTVLIPWRGDAHTDHLYVYDAALAATKSFRAPFVKTVLAMEILSETNFSRTGTFSSNWYIDITGYIDRKIELLRVFEGEIQEHPFPRSEESVRALATLRGSEMGVQYAEAFQVIRHYE